MVNYFGINLNELGDPAPWTPRETNNFKLIIDLLGLATDYPAIGVAGNPRMYDMITGIKGDGSIASIGIGLTAAQIPGAAIDCRGDAIFNENGDDYDFRIEGSTEQNLFYVDAGNDWIGIQTATPRCLIDVYMGNSGYAGALAVDTAICFEGRFAVNVQFLSAKNLYTRFMFGDDGDIDAGVIKYNHAGDFLGLNSKGGLWFNVHASGMTIISSEAYWGGYAFNVYGTNYQSYFYQAGGAGTVEPVIMRQANNAIGFYDLSGISVAGGHLMDDEAIGFPNVLKGCYQIKVTDAGALLPTGNYYVHLYQPT